ncbi:pentatricopeptide repeat-containing protein At1g79540 isoform X1 [Cornus florida]|uniref:pentatricopeptide repeat-containing protein At1g79540 isoform X1 n=2 Tax=Cornus florida TaxID=4283 RepID=UPI002897C117|nr:pentatricopeptide repeat-containing protein At1g79540 isoform X1 [Cornus florida]
MKILPTFLRPILQFYSNQPKSRYFNTSSLDAISEEVLNIVNTQSPMEVCLERMVCFLSPETVTSVLQEQRNNPELGFRFFVWAAKRKKFRSWDSHNLVVDMLIKDNGFEMYWKTLEELNSCEVPISSDAFAVLIAAYWKLHMAEKAVESFGRMKDFDCNPDLFTYNMILHVMVKKEVLLLALAVYNMMLKSNCGPNCSTFSILIDGLCRAGRTQDALKLFDEMTQRGIQPNKITYTVILSGLCKAKKPDEALRLFNTMRSSECSPDLIIYNALLNGFCKLGRIDEAFTLLWSFKKDGYVLHLNGYSCLIDALFKAGRFSEARDLFQKMFKENIKPDLVLYTIMIQGLSEAGMFKDALELLRLMTERGVIPDTQCYNTMIKGFCGMGLLDQARSLQLEISKHDCFPDTCTYTILICGMCKNGLVAEAKQIFSEMEKLGCFPSVVTFNALIDGLCKAGELEEAHLLFYKMEIGRNPSLFLRLSQGTDRVLDGASLQTLVEKYCESGLILKAYKLLTQLANSGVVPNITTYNILINSLCKSGNTPHSGKKKKLGNINGALKLFKDLQLKGHSPDSVTYGTLIDGLYRVDREKEAFGVFEQMTRNGCTPSTAVYRSLMTWSCRKQKNISVAFGLWLKYLRNLPGREDEAIRLVEEHFEKGELEKAIRGLLEMDFKLRDFDLAPYSIWLIGLCQARRTEEALKIFNILKECGIKVSPPSCVVLMNSLCNEQNLDQAIEIFLYTLDKGFKLMPPICNRLLKGLLRSQGKAKLALDLVNRMKSVGYDLDVYLYPTTISLLHVHGNSQEMENVSPG